MYSKYIPAKRTLSKSSGCKAKVDAIPPEIPATACSYLILVKALELLAEAITDFLQLLLLSPEWSVSLVTVTGTERLLLLDIARQQGERKTWVDSSDWLDETRRSEKRVRVSTLICRLLKREGDPINWSRVVEMHRNRSRHGVRDGRTQDKKEPRKETTVWKGKPIAPKTNCQAWVTCALCALHRGRCPQRGSGATWAIIAQWAIELQIEVFNCKERRCTVYKGKSKFYGKE